MANPPPGEAPGPRIDLHIRPDGIAIDQQRPAIAVVLAGRPVAAALPLVPTLLPICGQAQLVAARRAVAAARGQAISPQQQVEQSGRLWREQALAVAWRCTVDWPDLLDEPRQLTTLREIRSATSDRALGAALRTLVPGLDQVTCIESLLDWIAQGDTVACRLARRAMAIEAGAGLSLVSPEALVSAAARAFARETFDPLDPDGGPCEVGPLAMARDALIPALPAATGRPVLARILAQVLDLRVIYRALGDGPTADPGGHSQSEQAGIGTGSAMTARGPVVHRVRLDPAESDRVLDWRVLAPTDWHFAPRGPLRRELAGLAEPAAMRLLIASYDPCAPWTLDPGSAAEATADA